MSHWRRVNDSLKLHLLLLDIFLLVSNHRKAIGLITGNANRVNPRMFNGRSADLEPPNYLTFNRLTLYICSSICIARYVNRSTVNPTRTVPLCFTTCKCMRSVLTLRRWKFPAGNVSAFEKTWGKRNQKAVVMTQRNEARKEGETSSSVKYYTVKSRQKYFTKDFTWKFAFSFFVGSWSNSHK